MQTIAVVPVGLTKYRFEGKRPQSIRAAIQSTRHREWIDTNWERQPLWDETTDGRRTTNDDRHRSDGSVAMRQPPAPFILSSASELGHCARQIVAADVPMRCYRPEEAARMIDMLGAVPGAFPPASWASAWSIRPMSSTCCAGASCRRPTRYDGMPQYSNGIGMTRDFLDELGEGPAPAAGAHAAPDRADAGVRHADRAGAPARGRSAQPDRKLHVTLLPVVNQFFGETVTVSGLLMAQDVVAALRAGGAQRALLPRVMFDHTGLRTLDEYSLDQIAAESGVRSPWPASRMRSLRYVGRWRKV